MLRPSPFRQRVLRFAFVLILACFPSGAEALELTLLSAGEDEREDSGGFCQAEQDFNAGLSTLGPLRVGGDDTACDAEWGFSLEFDLSPLRPGTYSEAHLILRQISYDYSFTAGVFEYAATGGMVQLLRADLNAGTAVTTFDTQTGPGADLDLDLTALVQAAVDDGLPRLGLFVVGLSSQVGQINVVSFDGADGVQPPKLILGALPGEPNLVPAVGGSLILDDEAVSAGSVNTSAWQLQNTGDAATPRFRVGWYLSLDPILTTGDQFLDSFELGMFPAGADSTIAGQMLVLPPGLSRGQVYVGVIVDDLDEVSESNEADNELADGILIQSELVPNTVLSLCGSSEREYSGFPCDADLDFLLGVASAGSLLVGGDTEVCDSEWGSSLEFDLTGLPACAQVDSAVLLLRQRFRASGLPEIGVYEYTPFVNPTPIPRTDLTPATASATFSPAIVDDADILVDLTGAVQSAVYGQFDAVRVFLATTEDAVGVYNYIELDSCDGLLPPQLVVYCTNSTHAEDQLSRKEPAWLEQCHPNPFNPSTTIRYGIRRAGYVELAIFDLAGRRVRTLVAGWVEPGEHELRWNGRDEAGERVASGVYLYRLRTQDLVETRRMVLLK